MYMVQNDEIILPISAPILIEFMGYISIKIDKRTYDDLMSYLALRESAIPSFAEMLWKY